jgi:hypothetical protein
VHLQWGPSMKGPGINCMKGRGKYKQYKNVLFKGWLLKGQTHFLQSKHIHIKNFQGKKGPV